MLRTVKLYNKFCLRTIEIGNKAIDRLLPLKTRTIRSKKTIPKFSLLRRCVFAQCPCTRNIFMFVINRHGKLPPSVRQRRTDTSLGEGGKYSHRRGAAAPPLGGTKVVCRRGKPRAEPTANVGFLFPLTTLSYHSTRKKDFTERFFAKRSGERFKRGVRRSRTARKVCSAATTSVREKSVNPFTAIFSETALCNSFRTRRPLRASPCTRWCRRRLPPRDRGR